jgi:hypothetical protein
MKRISIVIAFLALFAFAAMAGMDNVPYKVSVIASETNSATYVLRGTIESIYVDVADLSTNTVTITSDQGTIFTKAGITADTQFFPRVAGQTTAGVAYTFSTLGSDSGGATTNLFTSAQYDKIAVAGPVKVTVIGQNASTTNTTTTTIIINK